MFSVCILCYGDYHQMAARCLGSIRRTADWRLIQDVRIGFNAVSAETRATALAFAESLPVVCHIYQEKDNRNVWKYPLMRRMLYDAQRPMLASHVMWFDDDSYITGENNWWSEVYEHSRGCDLLGSVYRLIHGLRGNQVAGIKAQPWYCGKEPLRRPLFVTGGWWVANRSMLELNGYPFEAIRHSGGDAMLGEMCRQKGYTLFHYKLGIAINADEQGRESKAARRGDATNWPWEDYPHQDTSHHDFEIAVTTFTPK